MKTFTTRPLFLAYSALWLLACSLSLVSCNIYITEGSPIIPKCLIPDSNYVNNTRSLGSFEAVVNKTDLPIYIEQVYSYQSDIRFSGSRNIINNITTEVIGGVLTIDTKYCMVLDNNPRLFITVRTPVITNVRLTGKGKIIGDNVWYCNTLNIINEGSGEIDIAANAQTIQTKQTGTGKLFLYGEADQLNVEVRSAATLSAQSLYARNVELLVLGSGESKVRASYTLKATIEGSGDTYYKGYPSIDVVKNGSGRVINNN